MVLHKVLGASEFIYLNFDVKIKEIVWQVALTHGSCSH